MESTSSAQTVIPVSKRQLLLLLLGALAFVAIGVWMLLDPHTLSRARYSNRVVIQVMGVASILFFGFCGYFIAKKLKSGEAGLTINPKGFLDNSTATAVGWVSWTDVIDIQIVQVRNQRFLAVLVKNPEYYANRLTGLMKKSVEVNLRAYGTPIVISSTALQMDFDTVVRLMREEFMRFCESGLSSR